MLAGPTKIRCGSLMCRKKDQFLKSVFYVRFIGHEWQMRLLAGYPHLNKMISFGWKIFFFKNQKNYTKNIVKKS